MRTLSMRDIQRIPALSGYNEIELIHPGMDETMKKWLWQIGYDTEYEIQYIPSKHRDLSGKVAIGFQVVGEISLRREFINSPMCSTTERIAATGYYDPSLTRELSSMQGSKVDYNHLSEVDGDDEDEFGGTLVLKGPDKDDVEEDYEWVSLQIRQLEALRDTIRGGK